MFEFEFKCEHQKAEECAQREGQVVSVLDLNEITLTVGPPATGLYSRSLACRECSHTIYEYVHPHLVGAQGGEGAPKTE